MDVYFVLRNLESSLRNAINKTEKAFREEFDTYGNHSANLIQIFSYCCLSIIFLAGIAILPFIFSIENFLSDSMLTWIKLTDEDKQEQLCRIELFKQMLENDDLASS